MSNEVSQQKSSFGSTVAGYAAFPAVMLTAQGASAVKNFGVKGLKYSQNHKGFNDLSKVLGNQTDVFSRSQALAEGYESYKNLSKSAAKLNKKIAKIKKRLPLKEKFLNLFRKEKITADILIEKKGLNTAAIEAYTKLGNANSAIGNITNNGFDKTTAEALENALELGNVKTSITLKDRFLNLFRKEGDKITQAGASTMARRQAKAQSEKIFTRIAQETTESGAKSSLKGFGKYFKKNLKEEFGFNGNGILNYAMTAIQFIPNITQKVIPAFKEQGFKAGMKEAGKTLVQAGADLVSYSLGGSIGRTIGAVIGAVISPAKGVGAKVGAFIGDIIGSMIVGTTTCKAVDKALGVEEEAMPNTQEIAQDVPSEAQIAEQPQATVQPQMQPQAQTTVQTNPIVQEDLTLKYANMPTKSQVRQAAYAQAFKGRGGNFNSYFA